MTETIETLTEFAENLSKAQKAVLTADDLSVAAEGANPMTLEALQRKDLVQFQQAEAGWSFVVLPLGDKVRRVLRGEWATIREKEVGNSPEPSAGEKLIGAAKEASDIARGEGDPQKSATSAEDPVPFDARYNLLTDLEYSIDTEVTPVNPRGLTKEDLDLDRVLLDAYEPTPGCGDEWALYPVMNEETVLKGALSASTAAIANLEFEDFEPLAAFTPEAVEEMFANQYKADAAYQPETLFRMCVPDASEHWPGCPRFLTVWLTVFGSVVMALTPLAIEERKDLGRRVDVLKRTKYTEKARMRKAAKLAEKEEKRKARPKIMKSAREAREKGKADAAE